MTPRESSTQVWGEAWRVLVLQAALAVVAAVVSMAIWGASAGAWALAGGGVCVVPAALFAFALSRAALLSGRAFKVGLFLGELIKIVLVMALFALAYTRFGGINALAMIFGFIAAIQGYFLAFLVAD